MIKISDFVLRFLAGADITEQLEAWDVQVEEKNKIYYLNGKVRTAIHRQLDPISCYVCLAMALFGPFWIFLLRDDYNQFRKKANKILQEMNKGIRR
ncbi:MAG: hypothetical protein DRN49_00045 [Thaumarchaeota archaeon]|nr:MAG: hypothetical protein DRN49_00045 [Nitrososphaerota archaeon]